MSIDILGPLPKSKRGKRFLLVITDRFTKLTTVVALRNINAYSVAFAFCEAWIFKYGPPRSVLSDKGKQFTSRFFQSVCQLLGLSNAYTSAYHPQTNGKVERYNRTILNMLRCYVEEHQADWDRYASALTYAYNDHVHRSTGTTPFGLVLSRPPPPFSLYRSLHQRPDPDKATRHEFLVHLYTAIQRAYVRLKKSQQRYKRDFDARVRRTDVDLKASDYVFIDSSGGQGKTSKLGSPAVGPFRIIARDERTFTIDRGGHTERVSCDRVTRAPRPANAPIMVPAPGELEKSRKVRSTQ